MKRKNVHKKILVIHGPNLHLLGKRQPDIYGTATLEQINKELRASAKKYKLAVEIFQSNSEGAIVEKITRTAYDFLIINPAAYTHTSVAIRDAILCAHRPAVEVHLSNIYKREDFRKTSLINDVVEGSIIGFGKLSYFLALQVAIHFLKQTPHKKRETED